MPWLAGEGIRALTAAAERASLILELVHAHSWQRRCAMMLGSVVVDLVDGNGVVHYVRLDSLLVDDGLGQGSQYS